MGFVEGEGCFSITIQRCIDRRPRKGTARFNIKRPLLFRAYPCFRATICEADRQILDELRETLGVGQIYIQKRALKKSTAQNVAYYYAEGVKECLVVKEFFQRQRFYTRKGDSFRLWCQALEIILSGKHLEKEGLLEICRIRDQMNFRKTKSKWRADEIEKILDAKPIHNPAHFNEKQQELIHNTNLDLADWLKPRRGNCMKGKPVTPAAQANPNP